MSLKKKCLQIIITSMFLMLCSKLPWSPLSKNALSQNLLWKYAFKKSIIWDRAFFCDHGRKVKKQDEFAYTVEKCQIMWFHYNFSELHIKFKNATSHNKYKCQYIPVFFHLHISEPIKLSIYLFITIKLSIHFKLKINNSYTACINFERLQTHPGKYNFENKFR
jgi:hypothetical protein